ncbi:unnamed protein product [Paramecium sonneborni]|uniref:Tetratricopeptide repeat protein n=1 Tax=Paramecium sonneborni TaxID=65129 RepID=A0A8S1MP45_9CILI|nr:unnamed protein product [Paramecium sonneborni]
MNQERLFICQQISHENQNILGFCLNLGCKESKSQFCLGCSQDPIIHSNCTKDLKGFESIDSLFTNCQQNLHQLNTQLDQSFSKAKTKYLEEKKKIEKLNAQLEKLLECLRQQDYEYLRLNLYLIKQWYQYLNNQEEIINENEIGSKLCIVKSMIEALKLDQQQLSSQSIIIQQIQEDNLQQGIQLLNLQKWQQANDAFSEVIKQSSFATFFQNISLQEMNQPGQGFILREQAKKMNSNLFRDLLNYSDQELKKNPRNTFMIIAKSYALNDEKKYQQAIEQCQKVLNENPQNLHALYRKSISLDLLNQIAQAQEHIEKALNYKKDYCLGQFQKGYLLQGKGKYGDAIDFFKKAIQLDPNFAQAYNNIGYSLNVLKKYKDAIIQFDKTIEINPNFAPAFNNKGYSLNQLKEYDKAIICFEKAIQLDPNFASAYNNKGISLEYLKKYDEALQNYSKSTDIDPAYTQAYKNQGFLLRESNKYQDAIETYQKALNNCKGNEDEFNRLIAETINSN